MLLFLVSIHSHFIAIACEVSHPSILHQHTVPKLFMNVGSQVHQVSCFKIYFENGGK